MSDETVTPTSGPETIEGDVVVPEETPPGDLESADDAAVTAAAIITDGARTLFIADFNDTEAADYFLPFRAVFHKLDGGDDPVGVIPLHREIGKARLFVDRPLPTKENPP